MQIIENSKVKEKLYYEKLENGMPVFPIKGIDKDSIDTINELPRGRAIAVSY